MTNEIKELLDDIKRLIEEDETPENMKKYVGGTFNIIELKLLLDYITNLQEENKQLNENNMAMQEEMCLRWNELNNLQQRIDKATNYILENICCDTRVYTKNENVYKVVDILRGDE